MSDDVVRRYNGARAMQVPAKLLADAIRDVETLREENARLREALKPFADMAHEFDDLFNGEEFWEDSDVLDCHQFDAVPTVGNFRAARAAIAKARGETGENADLREAMEGLQKIIARKYEIGTGKNDAP